jgi:alpha-L-fucosidase
MKILHLFLAPEQLQWQAQELGVLIHFNLETFHISELNSLNIPSPSMFDPYLLNTDNWVQTMIDFGAQGAVLVAKVRNIKHSILSRFLSMFSNKIS